MTDEGVTTTFYADVDGDIYGVTAMAMMACAMPTGLGGATANASTSSVVLLPNASGFIAVYTTAGGIFARTFGAATGSGTPVLVTATVPTAFDAATNGDDLIVAWSEYDPSASRLSARRFVASTLVPYAGAMLLNTSTKFTVFAEIAMAMTSTQVLIAASQPSAIGFTRCTNTLASVVSGTIRSTADDDRPKLDLVVDRATSERLLAFENGGALTVQFVSSAGATVGIASPLGAAGGSEVAVAPSANSSAPGILGAAWIEGTTARFETLSGSGFGASRTPVIRSGPTNIRTSVRVGGATAPLLDPSDSRRVAAGGTCRSSTERVQRRRAPSSGPASSATAPPRRPSRSTRRRTPSGRADARPRWSAPPGTACCSRARRPSGAWAAPERAGESSAALTLPPRSSSVHPRTG